MPDHIWPVNIFRIHLPCSSIDGSSTTPLGTGLFPDQDPPSLMLNDSLLLPLFTEHWGAGQVRRRK